MEAESLPGSVIQRGGERVAIALGEAGHAAPLREVLAQQPVGVLVGPALPGLVRSGEVEAGAGGRLDRRIAMEFGPVVRGDGADPPPFAREEVGGAPREPSPSSGH